VHNTENIHAFRCSTQIWTLLSVANNAVESPLLNYTHMWVIVNNHNVNNGLRNMAESELHKFKDQTEFGLIKPIWNLNYIILTLDGQKIPMSSHFKYLGFIIQKDGEINSDVNHKIQADWLK